MGSCDPPVPLVPQRAAARNVVRRRQISDAPAIPPDGVAGALRQRTRPDGNRHSLACLAARLLRS